MTQDIDIDFGSVVNMSVDAASAALFSCLSDIMLESLDMAPLGPDKPSEFDKDGNEIPNRLRKSIVQHDPDWVTSTKIRAEAGYYMEYAFYHHEVSEAVEKTWKRHTANTGRKYLEEPFDAARKTMLQDVKKKARAAFRTGIVFKPIKRGGGNG